MYTLATLLLATMATGEMYGSQYHGPIAVPHVLHNGYLADTQEVAAAKSAHLAALGRQSHGHGYSGDNGYGGAYDISDGGHADLRYHGPTAIPHVLHDGHIADTYEVAAAKAKHFAAVAKVKAHTQGGDYSGRYTGHSGAATPYHGPLAVPVVLKSGYLADTHEVAAAKQHYLQALGSSPRHY